MSDWWSADPVAADGPPLQITPRVPNPALNHPSARDLAIRTIYGEAATEPEQGQAGVAAVIRNRLESGRYGNTIPQVVLAKNQFEPWSRPDARARMTALKPGDPDYERIGGIVDRVFSGDMEDPTGGATHFFSPGTQAALGRRPPSWAQGQPLTIGGHAFYAPEGRATDVSAQRRQSEPAGEWWAGDPVSSEGDTFSDRFGGMAPTTAKGLRGGLEDRAAGMTRGPETTPGQAMAIDFGNVLSSAQQGTTAQIPAHQKNLISDQVFQSDSGEVLFRDPQTGQVVPTDQSKHVALRDPADNRVKVYTRAPETEAGPVESISKVLSSGMLAGAPTARPGLAAARAVPPPNEIAQAAERVGVAVPRAVASDSMITQQAGAVTRNVPFAGTPVVRAAERTVEQLGERADDVSRGFGAGGAATSGDAAKTGIRDWIKGRSAEAVTKLYDKVDDLVDPTTTTELANTRRAVSEIEAKRKLAARPAMGTAQHVVSDALDRPEGLTYEGIKLLRTSVRDMIDRGVLPPNMTMQELESVYKGLSGDLRAAAQAGGGAKGLAAFERANRFAAQVADRRQALAKIIGTSGDTPPEQVFDRLLAKAGSGSRADITALAQARKAIGAEDWDEFASGVVSRMGRDAEGNFSPRRFLTDYSKLSDAGKSVLFRSTGKGDLAQYLDDIATISGRFKELEKFANPSGTGRTVLGGSIGYGALADPLTTLGAVVGARSLAMILARPVTAAPTASWARAYVTAATRPSPSAIASLNVATRNLANTYTAAGIPTTAQDVMRGIQGPVRAPAESEQQ